MSGIKWTTKDELQFLRELRKKNPDAFALYRKNLSARRDWGRVDKKTITEFLEREPALG